MWHGVTQTCACFRFWCARLHKCWAFVKLRCSHSLIFHIFFAPKKDTFIFPNITSKIQELYCKKLYHSKLDQFGRHLVLFGQVSLPGWWIMGSKFSCLPDQTNVIVSPFFPQDWGKHSWMSIFFTNSYSSRRSFLHEEYSRVLIPWAGNENRTLDRIQPTFVQTPRWRANVWHPVYCDCQDIDLHNQYCFSAMIKYWQKGFG